MQVLGYFQWGSKHPLNHRTQSKNIASCDNDWATSIVRRILQILKGGMHDAGQLTVSACHDGFKLTSTKRLEKSGRNYVEA
ncbi:hypothetical protein A0U40_05875 [[Bacillus] sp. KCTC 13219]|nr:hypothetical protein A0U40_05875 [[Bacillus] sp. KCTC 13219]